MCKEGTAGFAVFGGVVFDAHFDQRELRYILFARQVALEDIAVKDFRLRLGVVRIDEGAADFDEVADLHFDAAAEHARIIRSL